MRAAWTSAPGIAPTCGIGVVNERTRSQGNVWIASFCNLVIVDYGLMNILTGRQQSVAVLEAPAAEDFSDWTAFEVPLERVVHTEEQTSAKDPFNPQAYFDRWLNDVQARPKNSAPETQNEDEAEGSQFFMESLPGSNCEVNFEGVLHFNGCSIGNIRSPEGTLVLTKRGRVEADIDVGVAVINGSVNGNITAAERVLLDSNARVSGHIFTPLLSVRLGAVFDGDCVFTSPSEQTDEERQVKESGNSRKRLAAGV